MINIISGGRIVSFVSREVSYGENLIIKRHNEEIMRACDV